MVHLLHPSNLRHINDINNNNNNNNSLHSTFVYYVWQQMLDTVQEGVDVDTMIWLRRDQSGTATDQVDTCRSERDQSRR